MPYAPIPRDKTSIAVNTVDVVPYTEYKGRAVYELGSQNTGGYARVSGKVTRVKGPMVFRGNGLWSPCRPYVRSSTFAWWTGKSTEVNVGTSAARKGNVRVWEGPTSPSSIWTPTQRLPFGTSTPSVIVGGDGVGSLNANGRNRLDTQLLKAAGSRKVNYGESLAESRQTLSMIAGTSMRVLRAFMAVRKGRFGQAAKLLGVSKVPNTRSASEAWLAYQYGWAPLLSDIYDSHKLLKEGLRKGPQLFSVQSGWSESAELADNDPQFSSASVVTSCKIRGKLWYRVSDDSLSALNQLGLINPLEVAWAVLPWSFVIDWFIPVGNVLEAFSARMGISFHDGYRGVKVESKVRKSGWRASSPTYQLLSSSVQVGIDTSSYTRGDMGSLPWPGFYYKSPFSTIHVANAIALLRTLRR